MKTNAKEGVRIEVKNVDDIFDAITDFLGVKKEVSETYKKEKPFYDSIQENFDKLSITGQMATIHQLQEELFNRVETELDKCKGK